MRSDRMIATTDFHTAGIGMRLVTSGLGWLPGATMSDKRRWFQERLDHLRTGLCLEPRGHRSLLIAVMTEAVTPGAHFGLFFIYPGGYYVSCAGSHTIANETTITGSIGVIMDTLHYQGLFEKVGVQFVTIKSGKFKDMLSGSRPVSEEDVALAQGIVMQMYGKFVGIVARERKLDEKALR